MYDLNHNGERQFAVGVTCLSLAVATVSLRFACKLVVKGGFHLDDLFIVIALMIYGATFGVVIWGLVTGGGGAEMMELVISIAEAPSPAAFKKLENYLESLWIGFALYVPMATAVKMSILLFYRRIFTTATYKQISMGVMAFTTLWFVSTEVAYMFISQPIDAFWDRQKPGKSLNFNAFFLATGIIEIIIDFVILVLPVRMVFNLQMPTRTKVVLASIFLLGGFVVVTGIIRLRYVYQPGAVYVDFSNAEFWTHIHIATALLCACAPIYKPLWGKFSDYSTSFFSRYGSAFRSFLGGSGGKTGASSTGKSSTPSYLRMSNVNDERKATDSDAHSDTSRKLLPLYGKSDRTVKIEGGNWPGYQTPGSHHSLQDKQQGIIYSRQVEVV